MKFFESTTLGEALGAEAIDENAIIELSAEYLLMVHGGTTQSVHPSEQTNASGNGWDLRGGSQPQHPDSYQPPPQQYGPPPPPEQVGPAHGSQLPPGHEPYAPPPEPSPAWDSLLMNWVNRVGAAAGSDGAQLLRIPILTDAIFPPRPTT